ncbi:MAG: hypothetical protein R3B60_03020 [Candidatus Paceibacterota bacterium]
MSVRWLKENGRTLAPPVLLVRYKGREEILGRFYYQAPEERDGPEYGFVSLKYGHDALVRIESYNDILDYVFKNIYQ